MAKKKAKASSGKRTGTVKQFLRDLYTKDPNIANDKVLEKVLAKFPTSKANIKTVLSWKKELRDEGIDIPKQRAGAKPKGLAKKDAAKKNTKKKATKKKGGKKK